jgi:hypothetical protein
MTDLEVFQYMLKGSSSFDDSAIHDNGTTKSIIFRVLAGIGGSRDTIAEAFFDKRDGKFLAIHHCD